MATALHVSLRPALKHAAMPSGAAVLDPAGPFACLGASAGMDGLAVPVVPSALALFGPRGACLLAPDGPHLFDLEISRLLLQLHPVGQQGPPKSKGSMSRFCGMSSGIWRFGIWCLCSSIEARMGC